MNEHRKYPTEWSERRKDSEALGHLSCIARLEEGDRFELCYATCELGRDGPRGMSWGHISIPDGTGKVGHPGEVPNGWLLANTILDHQIVAMNMLLRTTCDLHIADDGFVLLGWVGDATLKAQFETEHNVSHWKTWLDAPANFHMTKWWSSEICLERKLVVKRNQ